MGWPERSWARFTGFTLGYGYQPWRAAIGLLGVLAAALVLVFTLGSRNDVLGPATTTTTTSGTGMPPQTRTVTADGACTLFGRVAVAGDIGIPLVKAPTSDQCTIQASTAGNWFSALATVLRALAWASAVLFAAAFTSIIRKT